MRFLILRTLSRVIVLCTHELALTIVNLPFLLDSDLPLRIINMSSEQHRGTLGGPGTFGDKFRTEDEFKKDIGKL